MRTEEQSLMESSMGSANFEQDVRGKCQSYVDANAAWRELSGNDYDLFDPYVDGVLVGFADEDGELYGLTFICGVCGRQHSRPEIE